MFWWPRIECFLCFNAVLKYIYQRHISIYIYLPGRGTGPLSGPSCRGLEGPTPPARPRRTSGLDCDVLGGDILSRPSLGDAGPRWRFFKLEP